MKSFPQCKSSNVINAKEMQILSKRVFWLCRQSKSKKTNETLFEIDWQMSMENALRKIDFFFTNN